LVGFYPVWRYRLPRSSEAYSHLENLRRIPSALDALNFGKMLRLFERKQHYTKYPLFYFLAKALSINSPSRAAVFSAAVFSLLPLMGFLTATGIFDESSAFVSGLVLAFTSAFVYTMNFFSGGEPLAVLLLLLALFLHLKFRPLAALPAYVAIVFLHPLTSLILWVLLLILPFFLRPSSRPAALELTAVISSFSAVLLSWILFQSLADLPLGYFMTESLPLYVIFTIFASLTSVSCLLMLVGERAPSVDHLTRSAAGTIRNHLPAILLVLEVVFLVIFATFGVRGTQQLVAPSTAIFYAPLLAAVALIGLRRGQIEPFPAALATAFVLLMLAGLIAVPRGVPVYRLAPYGAIALALLLGPLVRRPGVRWLLPVVIAGLATTAYPTAAFYFGFEEQYFPAEAAAIARISNETLTGSVMTDTRMEDPIVYATGSKVLIPSGEQLSLGRGDLAVLTGLSRTYGFYPPGAQWFREPFELNLSDLAEGSLKAYDNGWTEILIVDRQRVKLGGGRS